MSSRDDQLDYENRVSEVDLSAIEQDDKPGVPSQFACPECGGVLWEVENGRMLRREELTSPFRAGIQQIARATSTAEQKWLATTLEAMQTATQ